MHGEGNTQTWGEKDLPGTELGTHDLPTLPASLRGKCSYCLVTDEEAGSGRSRLTSQEVESWNRAHGLSIPSGCFSYQTALPSPPLASHSPWKQAPNP